jgi:hypothetical protein
MKPVGKRKRTATHHPTHQCRTIIQPASVDKNMFSSFGLFSCALVQLYWCDEIRNPTQNPSVPIFTKPTYEMKRM